MKNKRFIRMYGWNKRCFRGRGTGGHRENGNAKRKMLKSGGCSENLSDDR